MNKSTAGHSARFSAFNLLLAWEHEVCGAVSSPVADARTVYVVCEHGYVFAFAPDAPEDRQLRWRRRLESTVQSVLELLTGGLLVDTLIDGLEAIDELTGETLWKRKLKAKGPRKKAFLPANAYDAKLVPPLVYVLDAHGLYALDVKTGKERHFYGAYREWKYVTADQENVYLASREQGTIEAITSARPGPWPTWLHECGAPLRVAPVADRRAIYCLSYDGYLHALDKQTGQPTGFVQLGVLAAEPPLVRGNALYIVTDEGDLHVLNVRRIAVASLEDEASPIRPEDWLWTFEVPKGHLGNALLFDDALFVAADNGVVYGLDAGTGQLFWRNDLGVSGRAGLCRVGDTLIAAVSGKVAGFSPPPGFGRQPARTPTEAQVQSVELPPSPQTHDATATHLTTPTPVDVELTLRDPGLPQVMWSHPLPAPASTEITVIYPHIYVGCEDGTLVAIHGEDTATLWQTKVEGRVQGRPQISSQCVCINTNECLFALDVDTGHCLWQHRSRGAIQMNALMVDQFIVYVRKDGQVVCLDGQTGKKQWERRIGETHPGLPCSNGEGLFVGESQGVHAVRLADGHQSWFSPTADWVTSPLACEGGRVFAGCRDQRLYALDAHSGEVLWVFMTKDEIHNAPSASSDGFVYVASLDRCLYALDSADGTLQWRFSVESWPMGTPDVRATAIYIGTKSGLVYAMDTSSGHLLWKHDLGGAGLKSGPVAVGSYLFAATPDGRLLGFRVPHS